MHSSISHMVFATYNVIHYIWLSIGIKTCYRRINFIEIHWFMEIVQKQELRNWARIC